MLKRLLIYYAAVALVTCIIVWVLLELKIKEFFRPDVVMDVLKGEK